jgi:prepilin-type N-terminal cleavage/methylation domain-containing protein
MPGGKQGLLRFSEPDGILQNCTFQTKAQGGIMHRVVLAKTAGFSLVELTVVMAIIASFAALGLPTFVTYRDRSRVTQVIGSSEAIRAALASYAASSLHNAYPLTGAITDFASLRLVVNTHGGMLPPSASFSVGHYAFSDSDGDGIADTYSMRLNVNGVSNAIAGAQLLITPEGIFKCTPSGNPC